jgi:hypothetical protein
MLIALLCCSALPDFQDVQSAEEKLKRRITPVVQVAESASPAVVYVGAPLSARGESSHPESSCSSALDRGLDARPVPQDADEKLRRRITRSCRS